MVYHDDGKLYNCASQSKRKKDEYEGLDTGLHLVYNERDLHGTKPDGGIETKNMIFNVAQLMKSLVGTSLTAEIGEGHVQLDEDLHIIGLITGRVRMRRVDQGLLVDGWVDLILEQTCSRCLKQFEQPMHVTFEERFYPTLDVVTGTPLPPIEEDEVFPIDEHHQVDLTEAIRQNVLLAIPMVTLCSPDCAGLCSQCGHDLNLGPCQCEPETDARLSILKTLLQDQSQ